MAAPVQPSALGLAGGPQLEKQPVQDGETESTEPTGSDVSMSRKTEESPRQIHGLKWAITYTSFLSSIFLFTLDNTIVADVQPSILNDFGHVELLPWIGVGFALGGICVLPWGKAYGLFNKKWLYISSVLLFEIGSAICGASPNMNALILGRVIAGVGGSGMYSGCLTYIAITTTAVERTLYMAGVAVTWGLGSVLGPVVGGAFAISSATWRWAFYINLPIGAIFAPVYIFLLPNADSYAGMSLKGKFKMMDWTGTVVFLGGTACFTMAINFGGTAYSFNSGPEITLWTMTGVLLIAFALVTIYHPFVAAENKLYPSHFLKRPVLVNLQVQMFLVSGLSLTTVYYLPLFFQFTRGDGPLQAGVRLLPHIAVVVAFSIISGGLMPKFGYFTPWYCFGSAIALVGSSLMYTVSADTSISQVYGYSVLIGIGVGCFISAGFAIVQVLVPPAEVSNAVGFMSISQVLGITIFLASAGTIYQNFAAQRLAPILPNASPDEISSVITGTSSKAFQSMTESLQQQVVIQITGVMTNVWVFFIAASALSLVLSVFLGRQKISMAAGTGAM